MEVLLPCASDGAARDIIVHVCLVELSVALRVKVEVDHVPGVQSLAWSFDRSGPWEILYCTERGRTLHCLGGWLGRQSISAL